MTTSWRTMAIVAVAAACLIGVGALGGVVVERIRFDQRRSAVVQEYQSAARAARALLMALEGRAAGAPAEIEMGP